MRLKNTLTSVRFSVHMQSPVCPFVLASAELAAVVMETTQALAGTGQWEKERRRSWFEKKHGGGEAVWEEPGGVGMEPFDVSLVHTTRQLDLETPSWNQHFLLFSQCLTVVFD